VLNNWRRHREDQANGRTISASLDPYSSGIAFDGWAGAPQFAVPEYYVPLPVSPPRTVLLRSDWVPQQLVALTRHVSARLAASNGAANSAILESMGRRSARVYETCVLRALIRNTIVVVVLGASATSHAQLASPYLYLNRCQGTCVVYGSTINDGRAMKSTLPCTGGGTCAGGSCTCPGSNLGSFTIEEFRDTNGNTGALADPEWNAIMACVRKVYSPYKIMVTDQVPPGGQSHNQGIVAGRAINIGYTGVGGIAPAHTCGPRDNVISFTFANQYTGTAAERVRDICATALQETAHAYGMDHVYQRSDGQPACSDPMTYLPPCGQQFFRNDDTKCGEYSVRPCTCADAQNAHRRLINIFGAGTPLTTPPALSVVQPVQDATIFDGFNVTTVASAERGIARIDLWLNNYLWTSVKGVPFASSGQPEASYTLPIPDGVPDGIIDLVVKAYDDIEVETASETITVTKGAPCTSASACAKGQVCEDGRCFWEQPVGDIGDRCEYTQYCMSGLCLESSDGDFCSRDCVVGVSDSCPEGTYCEGPTGLVGYCLPNADGGCCSVGGDRRAECLLSLGIFGLLVRRRRRGR
jgi:hypothetical protein